MTEQHPIIASEELVLQWVKEWTEKGEKGYKHVHIANRAAQWGADQELEACCKWTAIVFPSGGANALRAARRPKPLSETDQALETLSWIESEASYDKPMFDTIRRALQRLKKLEALPND